MTLYYRCEILRGPPIVHTSTVAVQKRTACRVVVGPCLGDIWSTNQNRCTQRLQVAWGPPLCRLEWTASLRPAGVEAVLMQAARYSQPHWLGKFDDYRHRSC